MIKLRDYQENIVEDIEKSLKKHRTVLVESPTGSGKRIVFCQLVKDWMGEGKKTLIIVHTNELKWQISKHLDELGIEHGFVHKKRDSSEFSVNIAMLRSLHNRIKKGNAYKADYVIVDEAHHSVAPYWFNTINHFKASKVIGFTATPFRADGLGLNLCYETLLTGPSVARLIDKKHLSPFAFYSPTDLKLDLSKISVIGVEYSATELEKVVNKPFITGKAIEHYKKYSPGKSAIVFCLSVTHALAVAEEFKKAGIKAKALYGNMNRVKRNKVVEEYAQGKIQVITSIDILCEGFDVPHTEVIIMLRPNYSLTRYLQSIGRGLRFHKSKKETIILDTVANVFRHGFPDEERSHSLQGLQSHASYVTQCPKCGHVHKPALQCPKCGFEYRHSVETKGLHPKRIIQQPGYLKRIEREELIKRNKERRALFSACTTLKDFMAYAVKYNFQKPDLWAANQYGKYKKELALKNNPPVDSKWCGMCSAFQPNANFAKNSQRCRPCQKIFRRKWYEKNLDKQIADAKKWSMANPLKARAAKRKASAKAKELGKAWAMPAWNRVKAKQLKWYEKNKEKILSDKKVRREYINTLRRKQLLKELKWTIPSQQIKLTKKEKQILDQRKHVLELAKARKDKRLKKAA